MSDEKLSALLQQATAKQAEPEPKPQEEKKPAEGNRLAIKQAEEARAQQVDLRLWKMDVRQALDESKLPGSLP